MKKRKGGNCAEGNIKKRSSIAFWTASLEGELGKRGGRGHDTGRYKGPKKRQETTPGLLNLCRETTIKEAQLKRGPD